MQPKKLILLTLGLLLCATQGFATQYNNTCISSNVGETGQNMCFTICKKNSTTTTLTVTCSTSQMTGIYNYDLQNAGGGTFSSRTTPDISNDGHTMTFEINWSVYPSSSTVQIYLVVNRNTSSGGSDIMGCTITNIDCSASCSGGGGGGGGDTPTPSSACSGTSTEASEGSFTTGYNYKFSTEGTTVNIEFEYLDNKSGLEAFFWNRTSGFQETKMSVSNNKATISLTNQTIGQSITFACKFAYSGGMAVTKDFTYIVGDNCSSLKTSNLTRTSDASVTLTEAGAISTITHTTTSKGAITYESSNEAVATVDNGVITAVANGDATITVSQAADVTYEAGSFTVDVTVAIAVTGVTLDQSTATLYLGGSDASKTTTLVPTVSPNDAADKSVSWSSSNSSIASVDAGVVTAVGKGNANIIVKTTDGNKTCTCVVTVKQYVTNIELNKSSMTLKKDAQETLTAQVSPENADDKSITWSSSDDAIATVSNGVVTAKSSGTATITATANDGSGVKATCTVTVPVPVTGVSLNKTATSLYVSESETLTATVEPSDAADKSVSWSTSDDKVATVSAGGMVTAVANGTAVITATSNDDNTKLATCTVTVSMYVAPIYVAQTTITDSKTSTNYTMNYSIAHNLNGTLTYTITLDGYLKDLNPQIHVKIGGEVVQLSGYTSDHPSATGTTTNTYSKDEQQTGKFYFAYADGGLIEQNFSYTVGADNTSCGTCFKVTF